MFFQAHQDYQTYSYEKENRDVVIKEYESAEKLSNSQTRYFQQITNIIIGVMTLTLPILIKIMGSTDQKYIKYVIPFITFYFILSILLLIYFSELQRSIIFNSRKVVVLRKLLGLDYGPLLLVLPVWRIEGASNPLAVRMFPGWLSIVAVPCWIIVLFFNSIFYVLANKYPLALPWYCLLGILTIVLMLFYRWRLLDHHETFVLLLIKKISWMLNIHLIKSIQYALYKGKLSACELDRIGINQAIIKKVLVIIEDKKFYTHKGIDLLALIRGFLSIFPSIRKKMRILRNGGSTISMQLVRTLLIEASDYRKTLRRKIIEVLLADWINYQIPKDLLIGMYLASVRFDKNVYGIIDAMNKYFGEIQKNISVEEAIFLIERISSCNNTYKLKRIEYLVASVNKDMKANIKVEDVVKIYSRTGIAVHI